MLLRHDKLDNFWFSLVHELEHINGTETWYLDNLDVQGANEIEQEAYALTQKILIFSTS